MKALDKTLPFSLRGMGAGRASHSSGQQAVCIANIGSAERRQRLRFGLAGLAFGAVLGVAMVAVGVDHGWRLALFLPFSAGAAGYFQARDKT